MEIYKDNNDVEWKCVLKQNTKFYEIYLMHRIVDGSNDYCVMCNYGKIGCKGRSIKRDFGSAILAAKWYFEKQFKSKTGNDFNDREFLIKEGKYSLYSALESVENNK